MGGSAPHVVLFHALGFSLYAYNFYYEKYYVQTPGLATYAGRWKYLTYLNELLQLFYFGFATFVDVLSWVNTKQKKENSFSGLRDFTFAVFAFPIAILVSVVFWGLYAIDRELIYPIELDALIPSFVNHILHTACSMLMILEAFITHHKYPTRKTGLISLFLLITVYYSWMTWLAFVMNAWPYHFLNEFHIQQHCTFFCTCFGLICLFHFTGRFITTMRFSDGKEKLKV